MKDEFQNCIDKKKIVPSPSTVSLVEKELKIAFSDLAEAEDRFEHRSFKWCTVTAYYAMFHAARALLYSKGYKERSHYCLSVALHELFVNPGMMEARLVRLFQMRCDFVKMLTMPTNILRMEPSKLLTKQENSLLMLKTS